jgi:hypothetical protein
MSLARNLQDDAERFSASVRLQSVASGLKRILDGQPIDEREAEDFEWGAHILGRMDWNSSHYRQKENTELCVMATRLRPIFYGALMKSRIPFDESFSEAIYTTLLSYGKKMPLGREELQQAQQLFQSMASTTLTELQYAHGTGRI